MSPGPACVRQWSVPDPTQPQGSSLSGTQLAELQVAAYAASVRHAPSVEAAQVQLDSTAAAFLEQMDSSGESFHLFITFPQGLDGRQWEQPAPSRGDFLRQSTQHIIVQRTGTHAVGGMGTMSTGPGISCSGWLTLPFAGCTPLMARQHNSASLRCVADRCKLYCHGCTSWHIAAGRRTHRNLRSTGERVSKPS